MDWLPSWADAARVGDVVANVFTLGFWPDYFEPVGEAVTQARAAKPDASAAELAKVAADATPAGAFAGTLKKTKKQIEDALDWAPYIVAGVIVLGLAVYLAPAIITAAAK